MRGINLYRKNKSKRTHHAKHQHTQHTHYGLTSLEEKNTQHAHASQEHTAMHPNQKVKNTASHHSSQGKSRVGGVLDARRRANGLSSQDRSNKGHANGLSSQDRSNKGHSRRCSRYSREGRRARRLTNGPTLSRVGRRRPWAPLRTACRQCPRRRRPREAIRQLMLLFFPLWASIVGTSAFPTSFVEDIDRRHASPFVVYRSWAAGLIFNRLHLLTLFDPFSWISFFAGLFLGYRESSIDLPWSSISSYSIYPTQSIPDLFSSLAILSTTSTGWPYESVHAGDLRTQRGHGDV